jgi:SPP1 family predicted phage head-tail adaptor
MIQPRLDRKICLLSRTVVRDTAGFASETWSEKFPMWAGRERVTANEQATALQTRGVQIDKMRIRFLACLEDESTLGNYRVEFEGRTYNILSCVEDLREVRRAWMILTLGFVEGQPTLAAADIPA